MTVLDGCDGFRLRDGRPLAQVLITDSDAPDLVRRVDENYSVQVWFRPDLARATSAVVEIVDVANLIPLDDRETTAADALDYFRHPAVWSSRFADYLTDRDVAS